MDPSTRYTLWMARPCWTSCSSIFKSAYCLPCYPWFRWHVQDIHCTNYPTWCNYQTQVWWTFTLCVLWRYHLKGLPCGHSLYCISIAPLWSSLVMAWFGIFVMMTHEGHIIQSHDLHLMWYDTTTLTSYGRNASIHYHAWGGVLELLTMYKQL